MTARMTDAKGWQPISTAPRGEFVLCYGAGGMYVNRIDALGNVRNRWGRPIVGATHWRPLPAPPGQEEAV